MARVNQGYYKKLLERFEDIDKEFESLDIYDSDKTLKGDYEALWTSLYTLNGLFIDIKELYSDMSGILKSQKFESERLNGLNQVFEIS